MEQDDVILAVECNERGGKVVRSVRLCKFSFEKLRFLFEKLSQFEVLFNDHVRGDFRAFIDSFIYEGPDGPTPTGLVWEVDDVGILYLTDIAPGESAQAHFTFWDRKFRGRERLCREMLKYVMRLFDLHRIRVEVPLYIRPTLDAVERIGFVKEGRMRQAVRYKDQWFDVNLYSVLAEDLSDGNQDEEGRAQVASNSAG